MDAAFASSRSAIAGVVASGFALSIGCGSTPPQTPIGMSDAVAEQQPSSAPSSSARRAQPWADFAAARAWPEAAPPAPALVHRRDGALVHVRVEPAALAGYQALSVGSPMADGARVIAWHETIGGDLLGGYLLEKRAGTWSALELDARGVIVPGDHAACMRCHDMAPADHLFGPRSANPPARESIDTPPR
ncbi:MAG TPA: hypothetical protein VEQ58_10675 [Polyangiaceae bacterium]|nr:hypothetical protein [Polyangiaceae bacterium]